MGDLVQPVLGLGGLAQPQVVQMKAVRGGAVAGPGGELPPELGAFAVIGQCDLFCKRNVIAELGQESGNGP
ncbi:hypothetical protein [Streptomyces nodosus]|uniref:hypothetical protein n=1 Tax=Streptomyces nodosus TaxID=40318 RepID=UPI0037F5A22E